jgi:hypothetical protein
MGSVHLLGKIRKLYPTEDDVDCGEVYDRSG